MKFDISSKSAFIETVKDELSARAFKAIDALRTNLVGSVELEPKMPSFTKGSNVNENIDDDEEGDENEYDENDYDEIELQLISHDDFVKAAKIAGSLGLTYFVDDETNTIDIDTDESDPNLIDKFFDALNDNGIGFTVSQDDEVSEAELSEAPPPKKVHTKAADKLAHRKYYRTHKAKIKLKLRRYRKTSHFKRLMKLAKLKARTGKTATGRRKVKRI